MLQKQPFEPIRHIPVILLSRKLAFLMAISSARRVSELAALSCKEPYLVCHKDNIVLRPVVAKTGLYAEHTAILPCDHLNEIMYI